MTRTLLRLLKISRDLTGFVLDCDQVVDSEYLTKGLWNREPTVGVGCGLDTSESTIKIPVIPS